jgi:Protein of unknown function (DUF2690)
VQNGHQMHRWIAVVVAVLAGLGVIVLKPGSAFAAGSKPHPALAAGCWSAGCTGLDPNSEGCGADATTVDSFVANVQDANAYVELRVSQNCWAAWARFTSGITDAEGMRHPWLVANAYRNSSDASAYHSEWAKITNDTDDIPNAGGQVWTNMVSYSDWTQACLASYTNGSTICTGRH